MDRTDTIKIMAVLKGAYPAYYKGMSKADAEAVVELWQEMFDREPYALVAAAVKRLIACDTKGFPPVIGQIKEYIYRLLHKNSMTEQEAWELVRKVVCGGSREDEFYALPEDIRALCGSVDQLKQWGRMDETAFLSVIASNFQRSYRARAIENKENTKVSDQLKMLEEEQRKLARRKVLEEGAAMLGITDGWQN